MAVFYIELLENTTQMLQHPYFTYPEVGDYFALAFSLGDPRKDLWLAMG